MSKHILPYVKVYFTSMHLLVHYISVNVPLKHRYVHRTYEISYMQFFGISKIIYIIPIYILHIYIPIYIYIFQYMPMLNEFNKHNSYILFQCILLVYIFQYILYIFQYILYIPIYTIFSNICQC